MFTSAFESWWNAPVHLFFIVIRKNCVWRCWLFYGVATFWHILAHLWHAYCSSLWSFGLRQRSPSAQVPRMPLMRAKSCNCPCVLLYWQADSAGLVIRGLPLPVLCLLRDYLPQWFGCWAEITASTAKIPTPIIIWPRIIRFVGALEKDKKFYEGRQRGKCNCLSIK